jgi:hypothetical protein
MTSQPTACHQSRLRLEWRRTWPDAAQDFCASANGDTVGRIYRTISSSANTPAWIWACHGFHRGRGLTGSGRAWSKDEAARAVEAAVFAAIDRVGA